MGSGTRFKDFFGGGPILIVDYIPIQFVLELQEPQGFFIEIQYMPIHFVLELQEPHPFLILAGGVGGPN